MITRGHVHNGVVVLADGVHLPEGQEVTVVVPAPAGTLPKDQPLVAVSKERQEALRALIGLWKTEHPPNDEEVERIIHEERMKKYG